jgi:glutamate synthase (NADPH/NADH) small chain
MYGHDVFIYDARPKVGGLNEYGIAAYKTVDGFASREVEFILSIGGIHVETGKVLGREFTLGELREDFDAIFLAIGLGGVNALGLSGEDMAGVEDAVDYIAGLRQAKDLGTLPVGRRVVVVGGGMTAIDIATQSRRLGAEQVTIVYRRSPERMGASRYERELAQTDGVTILFSARPTGLTDLGGRVSGIQFEHTREEEGRLVGTGETFTLEADMIFKAIGQTFDGEALNGAIAGVQLEGGRIKVDSERRTNVPRVWAGGDCVAGSSDLTVAAVADGRDAAESIHRALAGSGVQPA